MRILFILSEYLPDSGGGIISYYASILPDLVEAGNEIDVLVVSRESIGHDPIELNGVRVNYLTEECVEKHQSGFERFRYGFPAISAFLPLAWAAFEQASHGAGYDLVETTDYGFLYAPWVAGGAKAPVSVSLHGSFGQIEWYENRRESRFEGDWIRLIEERAFFEATGLQTNSTLNREFWKKKCNSEIEMLPPIACVPESASTKSESSPSTFGLVVGRFQIWKGPEVLCRALNEVQDCRVRWIGKDMKGKTDPSLENELADRYRDVIPSRLQRVNPISPAKVREEMQKAAFVCVPSTWDVFNLTVVEAISAGTPVVCSKEAGAAMLIKDRETGFLFDPNNPSDLAKCLRELSELDENSLEAMSKQALEELRETLNRDRLMIRRLNYYARIADLSKSHSADPWLRSVLSPRDDADLIDSHLFGASSINLLRAAIKQLGRGLKRRLTVHKAKQSIL